MIETNLDNVKNDELFLHEVDTNMLVLRNKKCKISFAMNLGCLHEKFYEGYPLVTSQASKLFKFKFDIKMLLGVLDVIIHCVNRKIMSKYV